MLYKIVVRGTAWSTWDCQPPSEIDIDVDPKHVWVNDMYNYKCITHDPVKRVSVSADNGNLIPWVKFDYLVPVVDYTEVFNAL